MTKTYPDCHATTHEAEPRHDCLDMTRHSTVYRGMLQLTSTCQTPTALTNLSLLGRDMPRKALTAVPNLVLTRLAITSLNKP